MARIIRTDLVGPNDLRTQTERDFIYNGLDCCITHEVLTAQLSQLDSVTAETYAFSKALQAPVLEMKLRGVKVDLARRSEVIDSYFDTLDMLERNLERIVLEGCGMPHFNWRSTADLKLLFYTKLGIPEFKNKGRVTVNRAALEKMGVYNIAKPIIGHMNAMRDIAKKISVLKTEVDNDGRIRTSYNIAGTDTGRFSSSFTEFGTGGNLQNVEEKLRSILIADKGMKFAKFDAKSGESFIVGALEWNLFGDDRYLVACESGDPHTAVARICWPKLGWTGDLAKDKELAETPFYRHYTYRFMCKKLGHGSNYDGRAPTLSQQAKLPLKVVQDFQPLYFQAFPAHKLWQAWVESQLRRVGQLTSLMGRRRYFWGRRNDDAVLRAAIAYDPQSSLADIVNRAMLKIWRMGLPVQLMMQDHDAITFQYPEEIEDEIIPILMRELVLDVPLKNGRVLQIPYDCNTGWNRGKYDKEENPDGLREYFGHDSRKRTPPVHLLDRLL